MPRCNAAVFLPYLNPALDEFQINTPLRVAVFLAQVAHESSELTQLSENLHYSIAGLMKTWPERFQSVEAANRYAHPVGIHKIGDLFWLVSIFISAFDRLESLRPSLH